MVRWNVLLCWCQSDFFDVCCFGRSADMPLVGTSSFYYLSVWRWNCPSSQHMGKAGIGLWGTSGWRQHCIASAPISSCIGCVISFDVANSIHDDPVGMWYPYLHSVWLFLTTWPMINLCIGCWSSSSMVIHFPIVWQSLLPFEVGLHKALCKLLLAIFLFFWIGLVSFGVY